MKRPAEEIVPILLAQERQPFGQFARQVVGLSDDQLGRALDVQRQKGGRLGELLRSLGLLSREQIREVLGVQASWVATTLQTAGFGARFPLPAYLSLCLPAYNEEANIEDTIDAACAILPAFVERFEVVVVNDGSRDATGRIIDRYSRTNAHVRGVTHVRNRGYGAAVSSGLRAARGDLVMFADSDGQFSFLDVPRLLLQANETDVVVGYRYPRADHWFRSFMAGGWNLMVRLVLGVGVRDLDCAFKLFRREVLDRLRLDSTSPAINAEILIQCVKAGLRIGQVPVSHYPRYHGEAAGCGPKMILRAFRELPGLWKLRSTAPELPRHRFEVEEPTILPLPAARGHAAGLNGKPAALAQPRVNGAHAERNGNGPIHNGLVAHPPSTNGWVRAEPKLRICMLAACPFPTNHGTPGAIRELAEAVSDRGHEVHVVTYHFGQHEIPVNGPLVHRITPLTNETTIVVGPTSRRPLYDLQMIPKTLEVIRRYRPHVIHAHGYEAQLVAWACRMMTGLPVIYSGHNTMADELASFRFIRPGWLATAFGKLLDGFVPRTADRCLPHSANMDRFFDQMGLAARTEPVINFGIDLDGLERYDGAEVRKQHGFGDGPIVLYAGVMDEFQRIDLLLEAMTQVLFYEPKAKLLLVVNLPNEQQLTAIRKKSAELNITDSVIITDPTPLEGVRQYLAACDVAVVPRPGCPGFPIKLLNYLAARRPAVLFASSASAGMIHGENVYLTAPDTGEALGAGIVEVLRDPELRDRLARNGYRFVRARHDRRLMAEQLAHAYLRTLEQAGRKLPNTRRITVPVGPWDSPNGGAGEVRRLGEPVTTEVLCHAGS